MDLPVQELNNLLSRKAISMGFELSVKNFTRLAIEELNMSVREFWTCYESYLIGAFGRDMEYLKIFQNTTMGKIAVGYATLYRKKVPFEEVVRDVIMDIEEYYFSEYGKDISNLQVLIDQFEDPIVFKEDKHGLVILEIIQVFVKRRKEGGGEKSISSVLVAGRPRELKWIEIDEYGTSLWNWKLDGQNTTSHALFPRARMIYN